MSPQPFTLGTTTTTTPAAKPNPSYFQSAPISQESVKHKALLLHLHAYQHFQSKPNANQIVIVDSKLPECFGILAANDWTVYDGPGPDANLVARAQGLHIGAAMTKENRFVGSSFKVMGDLQADQGEWAIVGGTGEFAYVQDVITFNKIQLSH